MTYDLVKVPTNSDEACLWRLGKASLHLVAFSFELFSRSGASDKNCRCLCEHSVQHESSVSEDRPVYVTCSFLHLHHDHAFQRSFCISVWSSFVLSLHFHSINRSGLCMRALAAQAFANSRRQTALFSWSAASTGLLNLVVPTTNLTRHYPFRCCSAKRSTKMTGTVHCSWYRSC